ncbi:hypothetical protein [Marinilactibacillus psychrotolerans]|uniref:hypothetical protein n=1 Tax=Marinilactibacillus psychrotolerans TaxID=191770 RepID=UPI0039AFC42A
MIRRIVTNLSGFSVNDVLQTDYYLLVEILCNETNKKSNKQEAVSLFDFVESLG